MVMLYKDLYVALKPNHAVYKIIKELSGLSIIIYISKFEKAH